MAINRVDYDGQTLIDISDTTATDADVLAGAYFYSAQGVRTLGVATVNDASLAIQVNGVTVATFTANASSNVTADITVPTTAADVGAVPTNRTVNGKALSLDITLSASDVGAVDATITSLSVIKASSSFTVNRSWAHKIGRVVYYSASITIGSSALSASGALVRFGTERPIASGASQNYIGLGEYSGTAFATGWNVTGQYPWLTVNSTIPANTTVFISGFFVTAT